MLAARVAEVLAGDGALATALPGFAPRPAQLEMACAFAETLEGGGALISEAGTGTGKTYAYLVPALLSGLRVIVSTGTKNLQDQLYHRDLPVLRQALAAPLRVALLKGRSNYLCRYRFKQTLASIVAPSEAERLFKLRDWIEQTTSGELAEAGWVDESDPLLPRVSSNADNCLGSRCPDFEACFIVRARRQAAAADLVVVNHHLLFADFVLKQEGFGEILPGGDAIVVDEAHQLPELALRFFGTRVSTRQLVDLARDAQTEIDACGDLAELRAECQAVHAAAAGLERHLVRLEGRLPFERFLHLNGTQAAVAAAQLAVAQLHAVLAPLAERAQGLAACGERAKALAQKLALFDAAAAENEDSIRWVEPHGRGGSLHQTPIEVAGPYQASVATHAGAWLYTSATLSVGDDFSHFADALGLANAQTLSLASPFDYARQARLYLPPGLPEPNQPEHTEALIERLLPLLTASDGGAFILCTSHRALRQIAAKLRSQTDWPLFVQGEDTRSALLARFSAAGNGVLIGAASFWEGVDVRGAALRLVVIDRLPFAAPGDPVFDAQLARIRAQGGQPFMQRQLPQAIIGLRQGVGRLIRDVDDRGLLVIGDPRVQTKGYGRQVLASLPPMPVLRDAAEALAWAQGLRPAA